MLGTPMSGQLTGGREPNHDGEENQNQSQSPEVRRDAIMFPGEWGTTRSLVQKKPTTYLHRAAPSSGISSGSGSELGC